MPLTPEIKLHQNIALLKSLKQRSLDGSVRLSNSDRKAIEHGIDALEDKVNGGR